MIYGTLKCLLTVGTMRCTAYAPTYQNNTDLSAVLRIVRVSKSGFLLNLQTT